MAAAVLSAKLTIRKSEFGGSVTTEKFMNRRGYEVAPPLEGYSPIKILRMTPVSASAAMRIPGIARCSCTRCGDVAFVVAPDASGKWHVVHDVRLNTSVTKAGDPGSIEFGNDATSSASKTWRAGRSAFVVERRAQTTVAQKPKTESQTVGESAAKACVVHKRARGAKAATELVSTGNEAFGASDSDAETVADGDTESVLESESVPLSD